MMGHPTLTTTAEDSSVTPDWVQVQINVFSGWVKQRLELGGKTPITDISVDLRDGTSLCDLAEGFTGTQLKVKRPPKFRVHQLENVQKALDAFQKDGVRFTSIAAEHIVDGNLKLTLGMVWALIRSYQIQTHPSEDVSETPRGNRPISGQFTPKKTAKDSLKSWINGILHQDRISSKWIVNGVHNFLNDFKSGVVLCALIDALCEPEELSDGLNSAALQTPEAALEYAMAEGEKLGIPALLSPSDITEGIADDLSLMTYISYFRLVGLQMEKENAAQDAVDVESFKQEQKTLEDKVDILQKGQEEMKEKLEKENEEKQDLQKKLSETAIRVSEQIQAKEEAAQCLEAMKAREKSLEDELLKANEAIRDVTNQSDVLSGKLTSMAKSQQETAEEVHAVRSKLSDTESQLSAKEKEIEELKRKLETAEERVREKVKIRDQDVHALEITVANLQDKLAEQKTNAKSDIPQVLMKFTDPQNIFRQELWKVQMLKTKVEDVANLQEEFEYLRRAMLRNNPKSAASPATPSSRSMVQCSPEFYQLIEVNDQLSDLLCRWIQAPENSSALLTELDGVRLVYQDMLDRLSKVGPIKDDEQNQLHSMVKEFLASDEIREAMSRTSLELLRLGGGMYQYGTRKIRIAIHKGKLMVRVGGGFMTLKEFVTVSAKSEMAKLESAAKRSISFSGASNLTPVSARSGSVA